MRILALVTEAYGGYGGIAQANRDVCEALSAEHELTVLPRLVRNHRAAASAPVRQVPPPDGKTAYVTRAVATAARGNYDLVFCGHLYLSPVAALIFLMRRVPYWLHTHGIEVWDRPRALERISAENASLVTAVSRYTRRRFLAWSRRGPETVKVLPDTVDPRFFPGPRSERFLACHGLTGAKVLLTVGRLEAKEAYKGHDRVIRVLPALVKREPRLRYLVVGSGTDLPRLRRVAADAGAGEHVVFAGDVTDEELPDAYRSADVFVMPSEGEGFGIVYLEAAACGIPVIGGAGQGSADALREGRIGLAVDTRDECALERAILSALEKPRGVPSGLEAFSFHLFANHARRIAEIVGGRR